MREADSIKKENASFDKCKDIVGKLGQNPLFMAFSLNLLAFLIRIIFFNIKYEVSDDYMTDALLSGAFGSGYDPILLFGNPILGHMLVFLYKLIPNISFYFVLLVVLGFVSATTVLYLIFKKKTNAVTIGMAMLFLFFFADDLYILVQFTKVSAAAGIAGGLLVLRGLWEKEEPHKIRLIVLGTILAVFGAMVRFTTIYLFAFFLVIAFLRNALPLLLNKQSSDSASKEAKISKDELKGIGKRFLACVLLIGFLFGLQYLGKWIANRDEGHREFNKFHDIRSSITDVITPDYEEIADEYAALGLDKIDYYMLATWNFVDREVYSDELLEEVAKIHKQASVDQTHSVNYVIDLLIQRNTLLYWSALGLYVLILICLLLSKDRIYPLVLLLAAVGMLMAFIYTGRTMYRVEWGVYFCAVACLLSSFEYNEESAPAKIRKHYMGKERPVIGVYVMVLVLGIMCTRISRLLPDTTYKNMSHEEYLESFNNTMLASGEYLPEKYLFPSVDKKPFLALTDRMENDSEHFYYIDFFTGIQSLYFDYDPWIRPQQGLFSKSYAYFGSVAMHQPGERDALKANGCDPDNPYKNLTLDNIYLVDSLYSPVKLAYVQKYYCPEAQLEQVGEVDGFMIWKIYVPERSENND
ncbi:MAG: hypothetical protein J6Y08_04340 [Clostridiales bacterium]|nr:hypothetical protein [Clostridiales bacterium]